MTLPSVGVALLPKLACPLCWPAYAGLLGSLGLGFLISARYLLPLTGALLFLPLAALGFRAKDRHGYVPFFLGLVAAIAVLLGKFEWESNSTLYGAIGLLIIASSWNALPVPKRFSKNNWWEEINQMRRMQKMTKKIEVFSAGCSVCKETVEMVKRIAGSHEVIIHDMKKAEVATKAKQYGVRSVPAVVVDGKLASCCSGRGPEENVLRSALA